MKRNLHALAMCQSMFCAIPCPWQIWDEEARSRMLLFLPVIGLEIGAFWAGLAWLTRYLGLPSLVQGILLCAFPYFITGFLHLDGFMDVTDALRSWRDLERRREILKDSHVGSFAVIGVVLLILGQFSCLASMDSDTDIRMLLFISALSRCCSALAVTVLKPMGTSQYAGQEKKPSHIWILGLMLCAVLALSFLVCGKYGFSAVGCLTGCGFALRRGYRSLDGMNGDISGYALTIGELCGVAVLTLL